jgi:hypothetical protein
MRSASKSTRGSSGSASKSTRGSSGSASKSTRGSKRRLDDDLLATPGRTTTPTHTVAQTVMRACGVVNVSDPPTTAAPISESPASAAPMTESVAAPPANLGEAVPPHETVSESVGDLADVTGQITNGTRLSPAGAASGSNLSTTGDGDSTLFVDDALKSILDQVVVCCGGGVVFVMGF